jgi:hypothetical protein
MLMIHVMLRLLFVFLTQPKWVRFIRYVPVEVADPGFPKGEGDTCEGATLLLQGEGGLLDSPLHINPPLRRSRKQFKSETINIF